MGDFHPYFKFMSDIIESGVWAELCSSARTLYPVLLKFSDSTFKPVWPNTETLMQLTGFKTKKSIIEAKKDLCKWGLLQIIPGTGHTSTRYYFTFNYPGSKLAPQGYRFVDPRSSESSSSGGSPGGAQGISSGNPNHIQITINNNQNKTKIKKTTVYGEEDILRTNYKHKSDQNQSPVSWKDFLQWAKSSLSESSYQQLSSLEVESDGKVLFFRSPVNQFLKQMIQKYFSENGKPSLMVVFDKEEVIFRKPL
jgi:hypothetical protein